MANTVNKFEDLNVWREGMELTADLYKELKNCKDFGLKDQIQRAAVSIPSNIAEGFERNTNKEFIHFLYISKASSGEVRTHLYLCKRLNLIQSQRCDKLIEQTKKISGMLYNLIKTRHDNFS